MRDAARCDSRVNFQPLFSFKCSRLVQQSPQSSSVTPVSLPEGMVVDPAGPGAIPRLRQNSTFFSHGVQSKLKGDESRTLLPAVDNVPPAGHL